MRKISFLIYLMVMASLPLSGFGDDGGKHFYAGAGLSLYKLDDDRIPGGNIDDPVVGSLSLGYQLNDLWATDISIGTDLGGDTGIDAGIINIYRYFGLNKWRPYVSAGFSSFSISGATEDPTENIQAGIGLSGALSDNLELRIGYQHFYDMGGESNNDDAVGIALNWHFKKPRAAAMSKPEPESVPVEKEVIDTFELLVQFDFDKSTIKTAFEPQFQEIARVLKESPQISMTIEGHTCWIGTEEYNLGLSERRANAVRQKFVDDYGIPGDRIVTVGFGEDRPIADNNMLAGRQKNRRAIAVILRPRMVTE